MPPSSYTEVPPAAAKVYRIILSRPDRPGSPIGQAFISEEGALMIWAAYVKLYGHCQTMETREKRGGIAWDSEIDYWKGRGALPNDFDWQHYKVEQPAALPPK